MQNKNCVKVGKEGSNTFLTVTSNGTFKIVKFCFYLINIQNRYKDQSEQ